MGPAGIVTHAHKQDGKRLESSQKLLSEVGRESLEMSDSRRPSYVVQGPQAA